MNLEAAFKEALRLAIEAEKMDEVPIGAVVLLDGEIVGRGYNRRETDDDPTAHAEILALREAGRNIGDWRLLDCSLVVTLEPCLMCLSASYLARVKNVVYGAVDLKGGALSLGYKINEDSRLNHRFSVSYQSCLSCETLLKNFFKKKREAKR